MIWRTEKRRGPAGQSGLFVVSFAFFRFFRLRRFWSPPTAATGSPCLGGEDSCETKPIPRLRIQDRVAAGHPLRPATLAPDGLPGDEMRKTNPIPGRVSSSRFPVSRRARLWLGLHTSHFTLQTRPTAIRAKRTQLGGPIRAKRSQFPSSRPPGTPDGAKRTQFFDCGLRIGRRPATA